MTSDAALVVKAVHNGPDDLARATTTPTSSRHHTHRIPSIDILCRVWRGRGPPKPPAAVWLFNGITTPGFLANMTRQTALCLALHTNQVR